MKRSWSVVAGTVLFAIGAIGAAIWLWLKRKELAVAAAKAVPGQASKAARDQATAVADAVPEQATGVANAVPEQASSITNAAPKL
jgi:hypothetical protein